jgi:hypothetical protein
MKIVFIIFSFLFLDRKTAGRRTLLLFGSLGNAFAFTVLGSLILVASKSTAAGGDVNPALGYAAIVFIYVFAVK